MYLTGGSENVPGPAFTELVGHLIESMGQSLDSLKRTDDEILLRTSDGFVYAFLEDPARVSLAQVERLLGESRDAPAKLVVLTPARLPLALSTELLRRRATVVESVRFHELVRSLGLGSYLGEEPRGEAPKGSTRLLPSARQLDTVMLRARTWMDWGVPAVALRFYRQAVAWKPEFLPAQTGIGRALAQLGLWEDAGRVFDDVLALHPDDLDARIGKAALLGSMGEVRQEVAAYRALREEAPKRIDLRTYLIAALIDAEDWAGARAEVEQLLTVTPEDPQVRFLYSVALERTGAPGDAKRERERARRLGLSPEREEALSAHLAPTTVAPLALRDTDPPRSSETPSPPLASVVDSPPENTTPTPTPPKKVSPRRRKAK
jgi:tetratricopeptide (TPR) repeat protein